MSFKNQNRETIHRIKKYEDKQCVVQHARTSSDHANITLFPKENSHIKLDVQKGQGAISGLATNSERFRDGCKVCL